MQNMGCYLQRQGHSNWIWVHIMKWQFLLYVLNWSCCDQLSLTVHVHNLVSCEKVTLLYSRSRSQWRFGTSVNVSTDNISDRLKLVWWYIIMSQSMKRKLIWLFSRSKPQLFPLDLQQYWNFFNPNEFSDTSSQDGVRHREQILSLYSGRETEDMAWVTMDQIVATLGHPDVCQAGVSTGSNQDNVERTLPL